MFNCFRHKPIDHLFEAAQKANVGIIARVPYASGLLTGRITPETVFPENDHRNFNRNGEMFDRGETFSGLGGVLHEAAFPAIEELKQLTPEELTLAQFALKWILSFSAVSVVIPGCRTVRHVDEAVSVSQSAELGTETLQNVAQVYEKYIKQHVHHLW